MSAEVCYVLIIKEEIEVKTNMLESVVALDKFYFEVKLTALKSVAQVHPSM